MKTIKLIIPILFFLFITISCNEDDNDNPNPQNELENLLKVQEFVNDSHTIELYTKSGKFYTGYNDISIQIKNNADNTYFENYTINWMPKMQMPTMTHSCPKSAIEKVDGAQTLYNGFTIFQMTSMDETGWSIKFIYTIDNTEYMTEDNILVKQSEKQNVTTFTGSDSVKYIAAMVAPTSPKIAINEFTVALYKMENMMSFPVVSDYTIGLDPRMPSMGNHSSPNNTDLTYNTTDKMYHGDLSLTMTGYWVLNLKLINADDVVLKGEDITEENTQSSFYLEIEF